MKLLEPQFLIIVLAIVLIIFGPNKLPDIGRSLGKTIRSVRDGLESGADDALPTSPAEASAAPDAVTASVAGTPSAADKMPDRSPSGS